MPNIKSAKKRVATNEVKKQRNKAIMTHVRTAIKKFNAAIDSNNIEEAERILPETFAIIDSAASKSIIHKNNAANKKSGLAKRLSDVKSGTVVVKIKKDNKTVAAEKALAAKEAREAVRAENAKKAAERAALKEEEKSASKKPVKGKDTKAKAEKAEKPAKAKAEKPAKSEKAEKPAKAKAEKPAKAKAEKDEKPAKAKTAKAKTNSEKAE